MFQEKYKNISFIPNSRDNRNTTDYTFYYKDSANIYVYLKPDYSFKITAYQALANVYSVKSWVDDVDEYVKQKLSQVIEDCKEYQLKAFQSYKDEFYITFTMKNVTFESVPIDLSINDWVIDSTYAQFVYNPLTKPDTGEFEIVTQLNENWYFKIIKPREVIIN